MMNELTQQEMLVENDYRSETEKLNRLSQNILIEWLVLKLGL